MKQYFIVSDIHGFYSLMIKELTKKGFDINNEDQIIISCGDLLDRGPETKQVVNFFYDLHLKNRAILIRGNHEDLFESMVERGFSINIDIHNGTLNSYIDLIDREFDGNVLDDYNYKWKYLLQNMLDYYETKHYVFVHGWVPIPWSEEKTWDWRNAEPYEWERARWHNGMLQAYIGYLDPLGKTIVCGHYHTSYGNVRKRLKTIHVSEEQEFENVKDFKPFKDKGIIAIDACTAFTGKVNCLKISEKDI